MKILLILMAVFMCIIGLCDIIHTFKLRIFRSNTVNNKIMLCILTDETAELDLNFLIEQMCWYGNQYFDRIICVNRIISSEILEVCEHLASNNNIEFVSDNELINLIKSEQ